MKQFTRGLLAALVLGLIALAADMKYDYDKDTNFASFKTFKFVNLPSQTTPNQIMANRIKSNIVAALTKKGLTETDSDTADLYVGYQVTIKNQTQYNTFNTGGAGWGWRGGYGGMGGMSTTTTQTIPYGTLAVDIYNAKAKQLIWRGTISDTVDSNPEKRAKKVEKEVGKLFQKYYPPPVKK